MKKTEKSINITIGWIALLTVAFAFMLFAVPPLADWYVEMVGKTDGAKYALIAVFYICVPGAAAVIFSSVKLLLNLKKGQFFTAENTKHLKVMSNVCLLVTPVCGAGCIWFYGFFPITVSAFFMFLILRVIKNVFEYGAEIKEENDLMI